MSEKERNKRSICFQCGAYTVGIGEDESWCGHCRTKLDENDSGPVPVLCCGGPYTGRQENKEGGETIGESGETSGGEP